MRASLLAIATTTLLRGARWASRCTHCPNPSVSYLTRSSTARAPWNQHATQIDVATLADAEQLLLAPGGVLPWHHANPGGEVASPAKGSPVADGGHGCGGDQRTETGDLA